MLVEFNAKDAVSLLRKIETVAGGADSLAIQPGKVDGKHGIMFTVFEIATSKKATAFIEAKVEGNKKVSLDPNTFLSVIKNRAVIQLSFEESLCVKGLGTKYMVDAVPYKSEVIEPVSFKMLNALPGSVCMKIKSRLPSILLKEIFVKEIYFILATKDKSLYMSVADEFHAAIAQIDLDKEERKDLGETCLVLPLDYANIISKLDGSFSIKIHSGKVSLQSKDFCADLPAISIPNLNADILIGQTKADFHTIVDSKHLKEFIGNISGILEEGKSVEVETKEDDFFMQYSATQGRVREGFKCKKARSYKAEMDAAHFVDIVKKLSGLTEIGFGNAVSFKTKKDGENFYMTVTK